MNHGRFQPGRRATLRALGALGIAAATGGGCSVAVRNTRTQGLPALPCDLPAFLAPQTQVGVVSGLRAIDVHAHFFNASDAAVGGYLAHSVGHETSFLVRQVLLRLERMISGVSHLPRTARQEYQDLLETGRKVAGLHPDAVQALLDDQMRKEDERIQDALEKAFRKFRVDNAYEDALRGETFTGGAKARRGLAATMARLAVDDDAEDPYAAEALSGGGFYLRGLLGFVGRMFRSRWSNLRTFQQVYRPQGVEAAFGALVDFDHWFEWRGQSSLDDQMAVHGLMSRLSSGYLLPIMAYNPWADELTRGGSLRRVQRAVKEFGFVGVKIYPPTGFRPWGNVKPDCKPRWWGRRCLPFPEDPHAINDRMKKLFCWASDNGVPVMAHANSTRGRNEKEDLMSAVGGWRDMLADMKSHGHAPILHLGHMGGDEPNQDRTNWTREFATLMAEQGDARVYGDLGYWTGLADCNGDLRSCEAGERLLAALAGNPEFGRHLMYGSDWFMINQERGWKAFPRDVAAALAGAFDEPDRVFFGNALECYGLGAGGRHRQRIIDHVGAVPAWMS